eukprot:618846-Pleurochrysis_carterae.AAC.1
MQWAIGPVWSCATVGLRRRLEGQVETDNKRFIPSRGCWAGPFLATDTNGSSPSLRNRRRHKKRWFRHCYSQNRKQKNL